jgi:hypothetical protein
MIRNLKTCVYKLYKYGALFYYLERRQVVAIKLFTVSIIKTEETLTVDSQLELQKPSDVVIDSSAP